MEPGFNPRARAGRDTPENAKCARFYTFQSTRPRGARHGPQGRGGHAAEFQSTRPRGARHNWVFDPCNIRVVSIHAPARGATRPYKEIASAYQVSIHAPARGATHRTAIYRGRAVGFQSTRPRGARHTLRMVCAACHAFQSTRPRGARPMDEMFNGPDNIVSIHAPARGATKT